MPAYLSHAIMADEVYHEALKEGFFCSFVDYEGMKTFSLGTDLAYYSKKSCHSSHNFRTQDFFLCMLVYIKEHHLQENEKVMSLLYGHICHYFLDIYCHPFVYYMEQGLSSDTLISNHMLMEGFLSSYLCKTVLKRDFMDIKGDFFDRGDLGYFENKKLLTSLYGTLYGDFRIMSSCYGILYTFSCLENFCKSGIFSESFLKKMSGFDKFLKKNQITTLDLLNFSNNEWKNPVTGVIHDESVYDLYKNAVDDTMNAISKVNGYLYGNLSLVNMKSVFTDLSYDTGVSCSLGKKMVYVRGK